MFFVIQESIGNADSEAIRNLITECVNAIFVKVENLFRHKTFSSLKGGFRVSVKRIFDLEVSFDFTTESPSIIFKEDDEKAKKLNNINTLYQIFETWKDMAEDLNREGEENVDARIYLTGRDSTSLDDVDSGSIAGWANAGAMCDM